MNFGEKLKKIRMERSMTQPQLAEAIGIEQSYLSKLENDKSVPSAEMFQTIMKSLEMSAHEFLSDIDKIILQTQMKQIPEVANFLRATASNRVHDVKQWLIGSAIICAIGFALVVAGNDGVFFSNYLYKYNSKGVILKDESDDIFNQYPKIVALKVDAHVLSHEEGSKLMSEFETMRVRPEVIETASNRGSIFFQPVENGRRRFDLVNRDYVPSTVNHILQYLGALFLFCGLAGFFIESRLRKLKLT